MSPALVLTRPPLSQVQFCCNLCLHQSLMGLRASLKNFLSSHQTPFTLFLSKPSASPHTTSQYGIPLYFRCLGFIMGLIFCKDKKTLTALEGMSESSPPTTHAYFAHMYADIQTGKKMSITFPFCFIADGPLLVLLPLIMIDAQILPLLPIGLLFALFSLSVRLSL